MPKFIYSLLFWPSQPSTPIHSVFFQEESDLISRVQEIIIADVVCIGRCELGLTQAAAPHKKAFH